MRSARRVGGQRAIGLAVMAVLAAAPAGCGGSAATSIAPASHTTAPVPRTTASAPSTTPATPGRQLTVTPTTGHPGSTLRFSFDARAVSGRHGGLDVSYSLAVSARPASGCVAQRSLAVAAPQRGRPATIAVGPAQLHGRWCAGTFTARVDELERAACTVGEMCPQFIRIGAVYGPATFRISP